jgi:hypothetical protein
MRALLGSGVVSSAIAWRSGGWSHVDFLSANERGWWSAFSVVRCGVPPGCQLRPLDYYGTPKKEARIVIDIPKAQWTDFWRLVKKTEGAPYDKSGLVDSFILGSQRKWRELDSFWCSEWFVWALEGCGRIDSLHEAITSVDPGMALGIASAVGVAL